VNEPPFSTLSAAIETWPIAGTFTLSRGSKRVAEVVVVEVSDGRHRGRGECVPYPRYGETAAGVVAAVEAVREPMSRGLDRAALQRLMPAGAARNGIDCALWDLAAKRSSQPAHALGGLPPLRPLKTVYTISLGGPDAMAQAARQAARSLLKIKLGGAGDPERIRAIRQAVPDAELIVDANEGWSRENLAENLTACADAGVTMVEQPLPAADDAALAEVLHPIPVCADESVHDRATLSRLKGKYEAVNIKLDKSGGLPRPWRWPTRPAGWGLPSWWAAWSRPRWRSRPRRSSPNAPAWSISTAHSCSPRTARMGCATRAARFIRQARPCGGERRYKPGRVRPIQ